MPMVSNFAALVPSGIITLIQVAITVMVGLVLLSVFVMPMLLPACFGLLEKAKRNAKKNNNFLLKLLLFLWVGEVFFF